MCPPVTISLKKVEIGCSITPCLSRFFIASCQCGHYRISDRLERNRKRYCLSDSAISTLYIFSLRRVFTDLSRPALRRAEGVKTGQIAGFLWEQKSITDHSIFAILFCCNERPLITGWYQILSMAFRSWCKFLWV